LRLRSAFTSEVLPAPDGAAMTKSRPRVLLGDDIGYKRYMNRGCAIAVLLLIPLAKTAFAQGEDFRVEQLRQEVAALSRTMREQARQIEKLEREIARLANPAPAKRAQSGGPSTADELKWVSAAAWQKLVTGMSEAQVLALLGPPTAVRATGDRSRTLFYTLELTGTGFLSGSVRLDDGRVREIAPPALR
jgi:hypothetical protein